MENYKVPFIVDAIYQVRNNILAHGKNNIWVFYLKEVIRKYPEEYKEAVKIVKYGIYYDKKGVNEEFIER